LAKQELLEKPGGVGAVPFRGACVRHRLDQLIFCRQGGGAALGLIPHREKGFCQISGKASRVGEQ
jgi:hypothetical protein